MRREAEESSRRQRDELSHMARVGALGQLTAALNVNQTLRDVESIALTEARRHEARLVFRLAPGLPCVAGDAVQLQQVLRNLVRNASEAMVATPPEDREILVRTSAETPEELTVAVGLAISRSIVEAHGARLWASRRSEHGLVVRFTLPALRETVA